MLPTDFGAVAEQLRRSTVSVLTGRDGSGSGVVWDRTGLIVTNAHVARGKNATVETWDGQRLQGRLLAQDPKRDLATLRVESDKLAPVAIAPSRGLRSGELVIAVGNPLGFHGALSTGVVHGVGPLNGLGRQPWVQAAVRLAPGNSGGPLADANGRLVGINTMVAGGLGLAVPSEAVERFVQRGPESVMLGVTIEPARLRTGAIGLVVVGVVANSAAERASLMMGDVITGIDGRDLRSPGDLQEAIESGATRLTLRFLRGERTKTREVTVCLR